MISDEVAREGLATLSIAAVMLIEDELDLLTTVQTDVPAGCRVAASLTALGSDLSALAAAAEVLVRRREEGQLQLT